MSDIIARRWAVRAICLAAGAGLSQLGHGPARAAGAPQGILNKTISISFGVSGNARGADGQSHGFNTVVSRKIYVAGTGRLFMRHLAQRADRPSVSRGGDFAPDDARQGKGDFHFQGNTLVGVIPYQQGARQITVTFDSAFTSCSASVIDGHAGGEAIRRKGPSGVTYELSSVTISSPSCSIREGNEFAGSS